MGLIDRAMRCIYIGFFLVFSLMVSCATIPDLKVTYHLPPKSDELMGRKVYLEFEDNRETKNILGKGASNEFRNFSGNISLSLVRDHGEGFLIGLFEVRSLFTEAFGRRLKNLGLTVVSESEEARVRMVILLEEFSLDLVNRRWIARTSYEARIVSSGDTLVKQSVNGEAERYKIVGHSQADEVMGELFTDAINRLDVVKLFNRADKPIQ